MAALSRNVISCEPIIEYPDLRALRYCPIAVSRATFGTWLNVCRLKPLDTSIIEAVEWLARVEAHVAELLGDVVINIRVFFLGYHRCGREGDLERALTTKGAERLEGGGEENKEQKGLTAGRRNQSRLGNTITIYGNDEQASEV